jgi:hypothetical protein
MTLHRYALSSRARTVFDDVKCEFSYKVSYIYICIFRHDQYQRTIACSLRLFFVYDEEYGTYRVFEIFECISCLIQDEDLLNGGKYHRKRSHTWHEQRILHRHVNVTV